MVSRRFLCLVSLLDYVVIGMAAEEVPSGIAALANLCEGLALTEKEATLFDFDLDQLDGVSSDKDTSKWILAATVLRPTKFNVEAFEKTLRGVWNPFKGMTLEVIDDNLFAFVFNHENDLKRIYAESLWHFENRLILLKQVS